MYDFNELCLPLYSDLVTYARTLTRDRAKAEDVVQDSFIKAIQAWGRWQPAREDAELSQLARSWMFRIVNQSFIDSYRQDRVRGRVHEHVDDVAMLAHGPPPSTRDDSLGDEVTEALSRIHPRWADVVKLVYVDGFTSDQAADLLKIPPATARSRMERGRLAMARILGPIAKLKFGLTLNSSVA